MIRYTRGNLLEADVEALVNTVNTVGVMGKGIALMFKEAFADNFKAYHAACKKGEVQIGRMFVTERKDLVGPKWIINFPTKNHWRNPAKLEWIEDGLKDLKRVVKQHNIHSIALPPLGSGHGGLSWSDVRSRIEGALGEVDDVLILVFEPNAKYQNVAKRTGVETLSPARALVAELVRRYWIPGIECSVLEIQKLAYFLERAIVAQKVDNPLNLSFQANKFGPYADKLRHLLDGLDGSYLHCDKRLADAGPLDVIWFEESKKDVLHAYLNSTEAAIYRQALEATVNLIDRFQSPLGMELLATVDWMIHHEGIRPSVENIREGLAKWPGGVTALQRKLRLFDDRLIELALLRISNNAAA